MRFIDSSVFVHALLKPSRRVERHEAEIKDGAKSMLRRIEGGRRRRPQWSTSRMWRTS